MIPFLTAAEAQAALANGEVVVVPTDTVWGLAIDPWSGAEPRRLADLKGRKAADRDKPVAWLVHALDDLTRYGRDVSPAAIALAEEFWPGPLTLVVNANSEVPTAFQSSQETIGLRWAAFWPTQILLEALGHPLAVTSANVAGAPPPQRLRDVDESLIRSVAGVLGPPANEGFVASGMASTVVECTEAVPRVLRAGEVSWSTIADVLDSVGRKGERR